MNTRLFLLGGLLVPVFSAAANLNRGDSSLKEISFGKTADSWPALRSPAYPFREAAANPWTMEHCNFRGRETQPDGLNAKEEDPGDERYFGSATLSQVSKPRMVDFSFGQPAGPAAWWNSPESEVWTVAGVAAEPSVPRMVFKWGDLRRSSSPEFADSSGNALVAIIPLSLLGVLGLTVRRTR